MRNHSLGFTLLELLAAIVILGIVAGVAIPRFVDLSHSARESSAQAIAGSLGSASAINHATDIVARTDLNSPSPVPVFNCQSAQNLLDSGSLAGYRIEPGSGEPASLTSGQTAVCEVIDESDGSVRATFVLHGVGPT
ncbi:type II secretion system protein [Marinimicrobium agarilyticum]|uniref:type II secretion system protein n=1 Tax=Marinimicrobium agarilyticum TaxID=306546 RepID=UPI000A026A2A|nr:type II secretion system protein [Marinimicrobium agarilyticum]